MARLSRPTTHPNLLVATGNDLATAAIGPDNTGETVTYDQVVSDPDWRLTLKDLLLSSSNGVRDFRGIVDFVVCYVAEGLQPDFAKDHTTDSPGRPFRGIAQLPGHYDLASDLPARLGERLGGLAHEISHYWLVPAAATIRTDSTLVTMPTGPEVAHALWSGQGMPAYSILGRKRSHWSPYASLDSTVQEAGVHSFLDPITEWAIGYTFSQSIPRPVVSFDLPTYGVVNTARIGRIERYIMGFVDDVTATQMVFHALQPRWTFPLSFETGLYLRMKDGAQWYLAFRTGPHQLAASQVAGPTTTAPLSDPFNPYDRVAFRVVQQGASVRLQVRVWAGPRYPMLEGCLYQIARRLGILPIIKPDVPGPLACNDILGDIDKHSPYESTDHYQGWHTLATVSGRIDRMGMSTRHLTLRASPFVRTRGRFCLWDGTAVSPVTAGHMTFDAGALRTTPEENSVLFDGTMVVPWAISRLNDGTTDDSPKLTMRAPTTDFAFGGQVAIEECLHTTWAGGDAANTTAVGARHTIRFTDFDFAAGGSASDWAIARSAPAGNAYRFAFCLLSSAPLPPSELTTKLDRLDLIRRGWEAGFTTIAPTTGTSRAADTGISTWP